MLVSLQIRLPSSILAYRILYILIADLNLRKAWIVDGNPQNGVCDQIRNVLND